MVPDSFPRIFSWEIFLMKSKSVFQISFYLCFFYAKFTIYVISNIQTSEQSASFETIHTISLTLNASGIQY